jgi:hypothetical protein
LPERAPVGLLAVAPSTVVVGEHFDLRLKCLAAPHYVPGAAYTFYPRLAGPFNLSPRGIRYMDNAASRCDGTLVFDGGSALSGPRSISCRDLSGAFAGDERALDVVQGFSFGRPGAYTIKIADNLSGMTGESNIIEVSEKAPDYRLFWGDLHSQTFFSDGLRCPEELYHFARNEGFLDVFALADHSERLTDPQWRYFVDVTNGFNEPGRFVTFVGLEWTHPTLGHRNVYYPGDSGPILRCTDDAANSLEKLYASGRAHNALIVPHHTANTAMGVDWDEPHDPEHVRLVEIYSVWGNSECPAAAGNSRPIRFAEGERRGQHVVDALARGFRLGFIGGGDIHDGRPGDDLHVFQDRPEGYDLLYRQGIMGVWARELTRAAIWEALWNRQVYATTNVRIILRFEVCGAFMGQTVAASGSRAIRVHAASATRIARIEVVRDGRVLSTIAPDSRTADWQFEDSPSDATAYYYARVTDANGELAWSSPVWVEPR